MKTKMRMKMMKMMKRLPTTLLEMNPSFMPRSFYAIRPLAADQHSVQRHPRRDVCSHLPALQIKHDMTPMAFGGLQLKTSVRLDAASLQKAVNDFSNSTVTLPLT